jgi:peptidoglycan hydrolase CwlO-like protein
MRYTGLLPLALSGALVLLGCETNPSSPTTSDATTQAAMAKRDEYVREMSKRLDEFDAKCKELDDKISKAEGQAKKDLEKKVAEAKVKREAAAKKLEELKEAGGDRWEKVKDGVGNALDDLKKVFD